MADLPKIDRAHIEAWLSAPRYGKYLDAAKGNDETAFGLYLWNTGLAQAVLRDVSFFKVALRNAYDRAISSTWNGEAHWLFDDSSPVRRPAALLFEGVAAPRRDPRKRPALPCPAPKT